MGAVPETEQWLLRGGCLEVIVQCVEKETIAPSLVEYEVIMKMRSSEKL